MTMIPTDPGISPYGFGGLYSQTDVTDSSARLCFSPRLRASAVNVTLSTLVRLKQGRNC
jgi:hypothetical protein